MENSRKLSGGIKSSRFSMISFVYIMLFYRNCEEQGSEQLYFIRDSHDCRNDVRLHHVHGYDGRNGRRDCSLNFHSAERGPHHRLYL